MMTQTPAQARRPTHPGEILKIDILPHMQIAPSRLAEIVGVSRQHLHRILNAKAPIRSETAVKLGNLFGNDPQFWLSLQDKYDIWAAEIKLGPELDDIADVRLELLDAWKMIRDPDDNRGGATSM